MSEKHRLRQGEEDGPLKTSEEAFYEKSPFETVA